MNLKQIAELAQRFAGTLRSLLVEKETLQQQLAEELRRRAADAETIAALNAKITADAQADADEDGIYEAAIADATARAIAAEEALTLLKSDNATVESELVDRLSEIDGLLGAVTE